MMNDTRTSYNPLLKQIVFFTIQQSSDNYTVISYINIIASNATILLAWMIIGGK